MDAPQLHNETDFAVVPRELVGKRGEQLVVIAKATFVRPRGSTTLELAPLRRGVRDADIPWGDPSVSSIRYPSDLCIAKPGTDVLVVARAYAPDGEAVPHFDAGLQVGPLSKSVRVFGLRVWESDGAGLSQARPTRGGIEIRYDRAWGGADFSDPTRPLEEPRNPVGMGIVRDTSTLTHQPTPSIEDIAEPLRSVRTCPPPAGLGAIGRHWQPRRVYLGTYDDAWLEERAPLLPLDHDDRANFCASPGLTAVPPLQGDEPVTLVNLTPGGGVVRFALPRVGVAVAYHARGIEPQRLRPHLDTVLIDTLVEPSGDLQEADVIVELVWRAALPAPRRMKEAVIAVEEVTL